MKFIYSLCIALFLFACTDTPKHTINGLQCQNFAFGTYKGCYDAYPQDTFYITRDLFYQYDSVKGGINTNVISWYKDSCSCLLQLVKSNLTEYRQYIGNYSTVTYYNYSNDTIYFKQTTDNDPTEQTGWLIIAK